MGIKSKSIALAAGRIPIPASVLALATVEAAAMWVYSSLSYP